MRGEYCGIFVQLFRHMMSTDDFLRERLARRAQVDALRRLHHPQGLLDFCSNDYLGLARHQGFREALAAEAASLPPGSTGSRLLSGHAALFEETEDVIARFHGGEAALIFNSGYDANLGLFGALGQRGDVILYDRLIHASIRDGIRLSQASAFSFAHNDLNALEHRLRGQRHGCFVAVESVYSMDGDMAPLEPLLELCEAYGARLLVDEAHATGVVGPRGEGLAASLGLQHRCFARLHTFGKALGVHGAAVVGSRLLKEYLINFARSLIYTTALPPVAIAAIRMAYRYFPQMQEERQQLQARIAALRQAALPFDRIPSDTPIQPLLVPGNVAVRAAAARLQDRGFDVRPILHPTVPEGQERLRVALHSFNTAEELDALVKAMTA